MVNLESLLSWLTLLAFQASRSKQGLPGGIRQFRAGGGGFRNASQLLIAVDALGAHPIGYA